MQFELTTIDYKGAAGTSANGVRRTGPLERSLQIVGSYSDIAGSHGFSYSQGEFTTLDAPGFRNTVAGGINGRGQTVGSCQSLQNSQTKGFLLDSGVYTEYPPLEAASPASPASMLNSWTLSGINNAGDVVGTSVSVLGFCYIPGLSVAGEPLGVHQPLGFPYVGAPPSGGPVSLNGINNSVQLVGATQLGSDGSTRAIRMEACPGNPATFQMDQFYPPDAISAVLTGINDDGVMCGYADYQSPPHHVKRNAFVYVNGTFTTFQFPGALITQANGISNRSPDSPQAGFVVVGSYELSGTLHGFVASQVAIPNRLP